MDVYVLPNAVTDATAHTVAYTLTAVPGAVYRLHTVTVNGLPDSARTLFLSNWPMKPGDPYSDLAVADYLAKYVAQPVFREYNTGFKAIGTPDTHQVDLTLTFTPNGNKPY
jgi:outer membrane translocation and assembly module TamA